MKSFFIGVGIIMAQVCTGGLAHAQNEPQMSRAQGIWNRKTSLPDAKDLASIEAYLLHTSTENRGIDCQAFQDSLVSFAFILGNGTASNLYPGIFNFGLEQCPDWDPYGYLLVAGAFFRNQDFEKAAALYGRASKGLKPDQEAHLNATLNAGACLVSLGRYNEAITEFQHVIDHAYERADVYKPMATINLSAAQLNAGLYSDAKTTIRQLPTENLSDYWRGIHFSNALIAHQKLADYAGSDSVWQNHLMLVPFESLPPDIHPNILSELLHQGDFIEFTRFKNRVIASQQSPLLDSTHSHYPLFTNASNDIGAGILWDLYRNFDKTQRDENITHVQESQSQLKSELLRIQEDLTQEWQTKRDFKLTLTFIITALLTFSLIIILVRSYRLRKSLSTLSSLYKINLDQQPQLDEDDLVVLTQALTYGKGLQKALLIVRRLQAQYTNQSQSRLNIKTLALYNDLNEREKEVADYIASGFNSKEIAQILNVTTQYIYNVRSRIREKFDVPDGQDLLQWLRESSQTQHKQAEEAGSTGL